MAQEKIVKSPDTLRAERIPPGQRSVTRIPILHEGPVPDFDPAKWTFFVKGLVAKERALSYQEFMALPRVKLEADIHCVTGWSKLDNVWEGVPSAEIKKLVTLKTEARFVLAHGHGGYTANFSLDDFFADDVIFTDRLDGDALAPEHGWPLRLLVPRLYLWKSVKWAVGLEFLAEDKLGYWESRGYHRHGDPWKEERYSGR